MIGLFIRQHLSWLLLLMILQIMMNLLLSIDQGLASVSVVYVNIVWIIIVLLFLCWRFFKESERFKDLTVAGRDYIHSVQLTYEEQLELSQLENKARQLLIQEQQDELLAWVHEMKSPMTAMKLMYENIEPMILREKIENEWLRLYLLLDQQLHATRLMTMEQDNRLEKVSLQKVAVEEIKAFRSWCFEKGLAVNVEGLEHTVITDAKWLGFIIRQILSNAVKYSDENKEIQIYTTIEDDKLIFHIQDCGCGIAAEDLPRVFRKSYTGTIGREKTASTGMGLYLSKQVANKLGLHILLSSKLEQGTTVSIVFPKENNYVKTLGM